MIVKYISKTSWTFFFEKIHPSARRARDSLMVNLALTCVQELQEA